MTSSLLAYIAIAFCLVGIAVAGGATWWAVGVKRIAITETPIARRVMQAAGAVIGVGFLLAAIAYAWEHFF